MAERLTYEVLEQITKDMHYWVQITIFSQFIVKRRSTVYRISVMHHITTLLQPSKMVVSPLTEYDSWDREMGEG